MAGAGAVEDEDKDGYSVLLDAGAMVLASAMRDGLVFNLWKLVEISRL